MGEPHPEWGPCDGFGPNGECSECTGKVAGEVERDLMGDPGPAEAMVRRAVEEEREAIRWMRVPVPGGLNSSEMGIWTEAIEAYRAAIRRRGE